MMKNLMMKNLNEMGMGLLIAALLVVALVVPSGPASAGGFLVDPIVDPTPVTAPAAPALPDPLHGFCSSGLCLDNGTVTPLTTNPVTGFSFSVSPGPSQTGEFFLKILVPNNENTVLGGFTITGALGTHLTGAEVKTTAFTSGTLDAYLGGIFVGASPTNPIGAFLPSTQTVDAAATGYFVYEADLGSSVTLFGPPSAFTSPLLNIIQGLPVGSFILGFLQVTDDTTTMIATANSGALFEGHEACGANCLPLETPEPASLLLLGSGLAGLGLWGRKRLRDVQA